MESFFKYLTVGEDDREWGLFLNVAGKARISPKTIYPSPDHPTGYYFTWENGRILHEYQINYITEGGGALETRTGKYPVKAGTLVVIRPGMWHRYRPLQKLGWTEHYIGFEGELADGFFNRLTFLKDQPVFHCSVREELIDTYYKIFDLVQKEAPGYQQIASALIIKLMGYLIAWQKQRDFSGKEIENVIQKARFMVRENIEQEIDFRKLAADHYIGYSYFRKMFKKYTGMAPHQYHLDLKLMKAKEMILTSHKSITEISAELGFESIYYFSRLFKRKIGQNPSDFRK